MDDTPLKIETLIDQIAESMIFAEPDEPTTLAQLHGQFEELCKCESSLPLEVLEQCQSLLEQVILDEDEHPEQSLEAIGETISVLQAIVGGVLPPDQAQYPEMIAPPTQPPTTDTPPAPHDDNAATNQTAQITLPPNVDEGIFSAFLAQQGSVLERLEELILQLEQQDDPNANDEFKRIIHTIKGETGLLGLGDISVLCHKIEDAIATHAISTLIDPLLKIKDWLGKMFDAYAGQGDPPCVIEQMYALLEEADQPQATTTDQADSAPSASPSNPTPASQDNPHAASSAPAAEPATDTPEPTCEPTCEQKTPIDTQEIFSDPQLISDFINESKEHLALADVELLKLESKTHDMETFNAIFRSFHTIKGVAGFLGVQDIQKLAHITETVLDRSRKGTLELEGPTLDLIFEAVDTMRRLINQLSEALEHNQPLYPDPQLDPLLAQLTHLSTGTFTPESEKTQAPAPNQPESENTQSDANAKLGQILHQQANVPEQVIQEAIQTQNQIKKEVPRLGEVLVQEGKVPGKQIAKALRTQNQARKQQITNLAQNRTVKVAQNVKVDALKLDRLVDMIGELVIAQAMVTQTAQTHHPPNEHVARSLNQLDKITRELQEMAMSLRMVPMRSTFQKMARLARDVAKKINKQINFQMVGEDTELDKTVVDQIGDPLVHMIRNAVDHGIETNPQDRLDQGKPAIGRVTLRAYHKGGGICIEIEDDGRGLDQEVLVAKAIERNIIKPTDQLSEQEIFQLIFAPGFSTAAQLTDVSGRGVGMDVVKRNIEAMRGKVEIQSTPGKGSIFTIRLPLTLAIIEGMVIRVASQRYILPTLSIVRMLQPGELDVKSILDQGQTLVVGDELVPLFYLGRIFNIQGMTQDPTQATVVIVEYNEKKIGIVTDELLGQQQIVIKNLGASLKGIQGITGGAIMPDGRVGLVIDIGGLVSLTHASSKRVSTAA